MNKFTLQKETRKNLLLSIFQDHHNKQFDDFYEGRDALLSDIEEIFAETYGTNFRCLAIDDFKTEGRKEARRILRELSSKV